MIAPDAALPTWTIRRAGRDEAPLLAALVERAYAAWVPVIGRRPAPMDDDYAARCAAGEAFVLTDPGGMAGLCVLEDRPDHLYLDNVALEPARQGEGLGRALLDFAEAEARRRGYGEIRLLTNALMARNIALYAARGYREWDRRREHGFSRVFMRKALAA
ncbi:GNAT family N-acetyltransferase [Roseomonas sp. NAR14]|uniref:GNAT family N-acetyltransferase n=1 Tax=Roseomonas acroporae TaxID=2937791 RepID=A0A9X1YF43_9PROT|nr:GNAT family N-acetyltransferase [Roseomonas acroporae]MCK8785086.1 GNAT family N-acetyltransferase [Roseomonas acroporae]